MSTTEHVPAWKRIGLKLKSASDGFRQLASTAVPPVATEVDLHPRTESGYNKRQRQESDDEISHKRTRSEASSFEQPAQTGNDRFIASIYKGKTLTGITKTPKKIVFNEERESRASSSETPLGSARPLTKKKSVTFTPETKVEDGESGQNFSKLWLSPSRLTSIPYAPVEDHAPDTPSKPSARAQNGSHEAEQDNLQPRKPKRPKTKLGTQPSSTSNEPRAACIEYLQQFHTNRTQWKFNKSRQNDLLRHIWDVSVLPASLDPAIVEYVKGLQGAASRKRLYDGAIGILDPLLDRHRDDLNSTAMDTPQARQASYDQAVQRQVEIMAQSGTNEYDEEVLATMRRETEQAKRADAILRQALSQELYGDMPPSVLSNLSATQAVAAAAAKRKTRKSRTATFDSSDSSSSESEGSSDSDDDGSGNEDSSSDSDSDNDSDSSSDASED